MATANKIQLVSNRVDRAKSFLLAQFRDKPNILAIVESLVEEIQEFENGVLALQDARTLNGSFGVWLDEIGKRNNVSRGGYNDNDYKNAIKLAMSSRYNSGQVDNILRIVELLTNDTDVVMRNDSAYLLELTGYFFCLADSPEGLEALADLFPVNTRIRFVRRDGIQFTFNQAGMGFGSGAVLNDLIYVKQGIADDPRFISVPEQIIPPPKLTVVQNTNPPVISGVAEEGGELNCSTGIWLGDDPIVYTYAWYLDDAVISGATTNTLSVISGMAGKNIICVVTATNGFSSATATSAPVLVGTTPIVTNPIVDGIGVRNIYKSLISMSMTPAVVTGGLTFKPDGTITFNADDTTPSNWTPTVSGVGAGYTVSYQVVSGPVLNIPPSTSVPLSADATFVLSKSLPKYTQVIGEYVFTIRSNASPEISNSGQFIISLEHDI